MKRIEDIVQKYLSLPIAGNTIAAPYSMVLQPNDEYDHTRVTRTSRNKYFAGKGSPAELVQAIHQAAKEATVDLDQLPHEKLNSFLLEEGIGIDCSGLVYNVLDEYLRSNFETKLAYHCQIRPGIIGKLEGYIFANRHKYRCSAATLTSSLNTVEIPRAKDARPRDMIRLSIPNWRGKHIAIITKVTPKTITYAHASERTKECGVHVATITLIHPEKNLEHQQWNETLIDGSKYKKYAFHPDKGDGIRRLRFFA